MPSSSRKRFFYNTLGFRLTFWYSVILVLVLFFNSLHRVLRIRVLDHAR